MSGSHTDDLAYWPPQKPGRTVLDHDNPPGAPIIVANAITFNTDIREEPIHTAAPPAEPRNESLDGLRGVAVLLVLLYHHHYLNAGWMGVDLFFVLSGYLITAILRRTRSDQFFWRGFWVKRVTRILPPFLLLLLATSALRFSLTWLQTLAYLLSFGDVLAYVRPTFEPLRPLWSLAIEEHFYIFWPIAVRFLPRRSLVFILLSLVAVEPIIRAITSMFTQDWQLIYFLTPFRLDGLALGSLLALGLESSSDAHLIRKWSGWSTALFISIWLSLRIGLGHAFTRDDPSPAYNGACYSLVSLAACSLIAFVVSHPRSLCSRALQWKPLVFTGTISYGLYLYQVLIRETLMRTWTLSGRTALFIDTPIIFLLAWLSFRFYEKPIIHWGKKRAAGV
jgi:peptidoglycan/LPS O-acetylase OafA/YrhL